MTERTDTLLYSQPVDSDRQQTHAPYEGLMDKPLYMFLSYVDSTIPRQNFPLKRDDALNELFRAGSILSVGINRNRHGGFRNIIEMENIISFEPHVTIKGKIAKHVTYESFLAMAALYYLDTKRPDRGFLKDMLQQASELLAGTNLHERINYTRQDQLQAKEAYTSLQMQLKREVQARSSSGQRNGGTVFVGEKSQKTTEKKSTSVATKQTENSDTENGDIQEGWEEELVLWDFPRMERVAVGYRGDKQVLRNVMNKRVILAMRFIKAAAVDPDHPLYDRDAKTRNEEEFCCNLHELSRRGMEMEQRGYKVQNLYDLFKGFAKVVNKEYVPKGFKWKDEV